MHWRCRQFAKAAVPPLAPKPQGSWGCARPPAQQHEGSPHEAGSGRRRDHRRGSAWPKAARATATADIPPPPPPDGFRGGGLSASLPPPTASSPPMPAPQRVAPFVGDCTGELGQAQRGAGAGSEGGEGTAGARETVTAAPFRAASASAAGALPPKKGRPQRDRPSILISQLWTPAKTDLLIPPRPAVVVRALSTEETA